MSKRIKSKLVPVHATKAYGGRRLYSFLTSAMDGIEQSAAPPTPTPPPPPTLVSLNPSKGHGIHWTVSWVSRKTGLDVYEKRTINLFLTGIQTSDLPSCGLVTVQTTPFWPTPPKWFKLHLTPFTLRKFCAGWILWIGNEFKKSKLHNFSSFRWNGSCTRTETLAL